MDAMGLPLNRVILANRAGRIDGKVQVTYTVRLVSEGKVYNVDPVEYPEGWPDRNQASLYALELAQKMKLMNTTEFISPQRMAATLAIY